MTQGQGGEDQAQREAGQPGEVGQQQDAAMQLRDFKTEARSLPERQRREAFQGDEFRRLVAAAALAPPPLPAAVCASHCVSHCASHCIAH
jgi:hypothetical protein